MNRKLRNNTGFTLLELLVVVAIIGFLSSISILALSSSQEHGRDSQRKLDQITIVKAAELYVNDFGAPPTQFCVMDANNTCKTSFVPFGRQFVQIPRSEVRSLFNKVTRFGSGAINGLTSSYDSLIAALVAGPSAAYAVTMQYIPCDENGDPPGCGPGGGGGSTGGGSTGGGVCGNGTVDTNEDCDDGNTNNGDGCDSSCSQEAGWTCTLRAISPTVCTPICGDGQMVDGEQCDNGTTGANKNGACPQTCSTSCTINNCPAICGNGIVETGEQCDNGTTGNNKNGACPQTCSTSCTINSCAGGVTCNNDGICQAGSGENIGNCASDCSYGTQTPAACGNGVCNVGETPGNCSVDCTNISMCYVNGQWDLCCAFGTNCSTSGTGGQPSGGSFAKYYGVCKGVRCEQRYLLQAPAFQCSADSDCTPSTSQPQNKFVPSNKFVPNWLKGLEPYLPQIPKDPGHHKFNLATSDQEFDNYYVSSHPDIVGRHLFCVWVSYERKTDNFNPYNDLIHSPTSDSDSDYWTPLCIQ